jgi:ABC-type transport system involved in multi-copper enzyme maturation permease subunit
MTAAVWVVARWEYRRSVTARWVMTMAAVFALLCFAVTVLALGTVRDLGLTGVGPASATLVNLGVLLPSLMGLVLGAGSLVGAGETGLLAMMAAQPIARPALAVGATLGLTRALWTTLAVGFGVAAIVLAGVAAAGDVAAIVALILATACVSAASVSIGVAISAIAGSRVQAISAGVATWIVLSLGVDLGLAALAPSIHLGPAGLLVAVLADPLESGRILALLGSNLEGTALGPFGAYLLSAFGTVGSVVLLCATLAAWFLAPMWLARTALRARDL